MPLDPSIISSAKPLDITGAITNAMTMKHLAMQSQMQDLQVQQEQQKINDQNAMRQAYANNVDQSGNVNQGGMLSDLAKTAPHLAPQAAQNFANMNYEIQNNRIKSSLAKIDYASQVLGGVKDQKSYEGAMQNIQQMGGDISDMPSLYAQGGKEAIASKITEGMSAKDQLANQAAQRGLDIKQQDLDVKRQQFVQGKQQTALQDAMSAINTSRTTPDVKQAYIDRYNAQKVIDIVKAPGDPNKVNVNMVPIVAAEVAKIAQGGAPQHEELSTITPQDAKMMIARTKQYLASNPEAGEQGAFLKVYQDYASMIQSNANSVINNSVGKQIETRKPWLNPNDYAALKNNYIDNPYGPSGPKQTDAGNNKQGKGDSTSHSAMPIGAVSNGMVKTKAGWIPQQESVNASK